MFPRIVMARRHDEAISQLVLTRRLLHPLLRVRNDDKNSEAASCTRHGEEARRSHLTISTYPQVASPLLRVKQ